MDTNVRKLVEEKSRQWPIKVIVFIILLTLMFLGLVIGFTFVLFQDNQLVNEAEPLSNGRRILQTESNINTAAQWNPRSHLRKIYDLTATTTPDTTVFPGVDPFSSEPILSLKKGDIVGLSKMKLANHLGTHIDFPQHLFINGKNSSSHKLDQLRGKGIIIEVPDTMKAITKEFIQKSEIKEQDIVFFKTANTKIPKTGPFNPNFVYVEADAARELVLKKVKIVGIDYLSIDGQTAQDLPTHKLLLSNQILILQDLELKDVPAGRCFIQIMPINIANMDGLPARVTCQF